MSKEAGGTAVLLVGVLLVRLVLTEVYQRYVQTAMGPWLLLAGVLLVVLGLVAVVSGLRAPVGAGIVHSRGEDGHGEDGHGEDGHGGHAHTHGDRVGWLLLVPVLAVLLAPPPALGSYGVDRAATSISLGAGGLTYPPLAAGGPYPMAVREFGERAVDSNGGSFGGNPVELTGFVAGPDGGGGYRLARFQISCCAADAVAAVVRVFEPNGPPRPRDSWVTVQGTFRALGPDGVPEIDAVAAQTVDAPVDPYE